ncbi:MAG: DNA replication protein DnaD [Coriobacteriia bacterium]|nr:DNA replication protein DnaD [Coriobacteriia bacterium]
MTKLEAVEYEPFETIRQVDESGHEFWYARDLQRVLGYAKWENFSKVIDRAMLACKNSGFGTEDHFPGIRKMVRIGSGAEKSVTDYKLSRYACYLIVQNGDPRKEIIALGQTYFAIQTRRQELADTFNRLDANLFRITQTEEKMRIDQVASAAEANDAHYKVAEKIRAAMVELGTTLPENLPTPKKSVQVIEREEIRKLRESKTSLMLDE